jgi:exopolysaccharide production protein ExoY
MTSYQLIKRLLDVVGAIVGIIVFSPLMLVASIWIKLVSPKGPVFADIPMRVGKDKSKFKFFKFRSMFPNAHDYLIKDPVLYKKYCDNNYKLPAEEDPRIIKGGIFMRKFSIDELPQFFNVLIGDMSLVGPRAYYFYEIDEQTKKYPETAAYIEDAVKVKPGITGVWQTNGRSEVGFVERAKMDALYAKNVSILYDLGIILKTPYVVLARKGSV